MNIILCFAPTGQRRSAQGKRIRVSGSRRPGSVSISGHCVPQRGTGNCAISCSCAPLGHTVIFGPFPGAALRRCHGDACPRLSSSAPLGPIALLCVPPECVNMSVNSLEQNHLNSNIRISELLRTPGWSIFPYLRGCLTAPTAKSKNPSTAVKGIGADQP